MFGMFFFFFKQKTAYEMRISDWSSDVCSSDLRIAKQSRNMVIFPNLVINDVMAITVRTFWPTAPDYMEVNAWALAPVEESEWLRKFRLFNFTEFLGPGGFATPDDVEEIGRAHV